MVNRGWVPLDFKDQDAHKFGAASGEIVGLLYRGDLKTKYTKPNTPIVQYYHRVDPYEHAVVC